VLYWLSDFNHNDETFLNIVGAQRFAADYGIAIVAPDTCPRGSQIPSAPKHNLESAAYSNFYVTATEAPWNRHFHMYEYVVSELPTLVKANFSVDARKQSICGHGMGGHGALIIALKNPDKYQSVSALAPICSPLLSSWGRSAFQQYLGENTALWNAYDTCSLIAAATKKPFEILIDQGLSDPFLLEHLKPGLLQEVCTKHNYPLKLRFQPGYDHSFHFVQSFIADHIDFHALKLIV
jgi:S-formylglutathione hydrolase